MRKSNFRIISAVPMPLNLCLFTAKLWSNVDFAPQNYGAMHTLPRKIMEPLFFALQNYRTSFFAPQNYVAMQTFPQKYGAMQTLPRKITET